MFRPTSESIFAHPLLPLSIAITSLVVANVHGMLLARLPPIPKKMVSLRPPFQFAIPISSFGYNTEDTKVTTTIT